MKTILAFVLIFVGVNASAASPSVAEWAKINNDLKNQNSLTLIKVEEVRAKANAAEEAAEKLKAEVASARTEVAKSKKGNVISFAGFEISMGSTSAQMQAQANAQRRLESALAKQKEAKVSADKLKGIVKDLDTKMIKALDDLDRSEADQKTVNAAVFNVVRSQGITQKFSDVQAKIGNTDQTLSYVTSAYDQSTIGAYIKDKMGLFVNSLLFCEAKARCDVPQPKRIDNKRIEEVLFPGSSASTSSNNYYDRANTPERNPSDR